MMKKKMNVLITSASAKVALVKSFVCATKKNGMKTFTADIKNNVAAAFFSDCHFVLPKTLDEIAFVSELKKICIDNDIGLVVPTRDGEIKIMSKIKDEMIKLGIRILVPKHESANICTNKRVFSKFIKDAGYNPIPELNADELSFPVFVRPVCGAAAGRGTYRADNKIHLDKVLSNPNEFMIHPFIDSDEFSIDLLMNLDGTQAIQAVVRRRDHVVSGESKISKIVKIPSLEKISMDIGEKLGLVGHNVIQAFGNSSWFGEDLIIEANARFGGASNLSIVAGLDSPNRIIKMMLGDESAYSVNDIDIGLTMYRYSEDFMHNG